MSDFILTVGGRKVYAGQLEEEIIQPDPVRFVQWYMQQEDKVVLGLIRGCAPCPAVFILKDDPHAKITQQWQYYLRAANYNMTLENVYLLLDSALAFANRTGYRHGRIRADYFHNKDLQYKVPQLDKVRTTSRSIMTGVEEFDYPTFTYNTSSKLMQIVVRTLSLIGAKNLLLRKEPVLNIKVFDSRKNPPLKPGYSYPRDISEVDPNAYLYMPETHPEMFLVANIVNGQGEVVQFPRGATYPWIDDGKTPYSFMPHIADLGYGQIKYPLRYLYKVPLGSPKPRALRYE